MIRDVYCVTSGWNATLYGIEKQLKVARIMTKRSHLIRHRLFIQHRSSLVPKHVIVCKFSVSYRSVKALLSKV